ncbi:hypothetical protein DFH09DRAFT_365687 [Mycena vulgaris]|nr:hypothetical protein DFH09DRAFT_365687 [Mycena vulgaris]
MLSILPLELTTEIFLLTLPDIPSDPHPSQAPLLLTHVSQDWRHVALAIPQLWSSLTLSDGHVHNHLTGLIEEWLQRAKLVSLSLWVGYSFPLTIMRLISRHPAKWKALEFHTLRTGGIIRELSEVKPIGGFPSLRKLVIDSDADFFQPTDSLLAGFKNAPQLQELHFEGVPMWLEKLRVPWSQLTTYACTSRSMFVADVLRVLASTPNIVHCRVTTSEFNPTANPIPPLLHLKSFTFHSRIQAINCMYILRNLTLPALCTLDVGILQPDAIEALISFMERSSCKLLDFCASTRDTPSASFIPCLRAMPALSSLRLAVPSSDESIAAIFQRLGDDAHFLPALDHLTIVSDGKAVFPYEALLEMLKSRSDSDRQVQLRRFALRWTSQPDDSFFPTADMGPKLIATGVVLQICADHQKEA